ncbi:MAG: metalloregulator ArsR/SmtB family transcription factor [Desulfobacterota bacterium]|nr:metalloregulator ArsR/SmtB family transcription factor [Thermodesulfobacteriota bacterium]
MNAHNKIPKKKAKGSAGQEPVAKSLQDGELSGTAFLSKCLSDDNRLRILLALNNGRKSVSQIVEELNLSQPLVSHHLKELKRFLLVRIERSGPFVYYEMTDKKVIEIVNALAGLARNLLANRKTF